MYPRSIFRITTLILLLASPSVAAGTGPSHLSVSQAVAEALANNPAMHQAEARIQAAAAGIRSARADFFPAATFNYAYTGMKEKPLMKTGGNEVQTADRNLYNWNVTVVQPLFTGFALSARREMANLDTGIRRFEKEQTVLDLARDTRNACYNLLLAHKLLRVAVDEVKALDAHRGDAVLFYDQGLIPRNDLLKSEVALANARQQMERARAGEKKAMAQLNRLLNRPVAGEISIRDIPTLQPRVLDRDTLGPRALEHRPVMRAVKKSIEKLGFAEQLARSTWYPEISLIGQHEQEGDSPGASENDFVNPRNTSIRLQATWRFWDWGKTRAEVNRAQHDVRALESGMAALGDRILQEVRNAWLDCGVALKNITTARRSQDQALENWRITNLQYHQQVATSTDVLDARTFLTQADTNYYRALYGYLSALAELDRAMGTAPERRSP